MIIKCDSNGEIIGTIEGSYDLDRLNIQNNFIEKKPENVPEKLKEHKVEDGKLVKQ